MAHKHTAQGVASESEPSYGYKQKSETGNMDEFKLFVLSLSYNYGVNVASKTKGKLDRYDILKIIRVNTHEYLVAKSYMVSEDSPQKQRAVCFPSFS